MDDVGFSRPRFKLLDYSTTSGILLVVMTQETYTEQIVAAWEENYKTGLLTFWILVALHNQPSHVGEVKQFIESTAQTNLTADEKSLYRSLVRLKKMELVGTMPRPSTSGGPSLNIYSLTPQGRKALGLFFRRNIASVFLTKEFNKIMKGII